MKPERATTARLEPGEDTIDRGNAVVRTMNGRAVVVLDWSIRLHDDTVLRRRTQGSTEEQVRQRARAAADALLATTQPSARLRALAREIVGLSPTQRRELLRLLAELM